MGLAEWSLTNTKFGQAKQDKEEQQEIDDTVVDPSTTNVDIEDYSDNS